MLHFDRVSKSFGSTPAVVDLSLAVQNGEIFGLLGPNGAGKTTAVSLAVGLLQADSGRVQIAERYSPRDPMTRRQIGVAPQMTALYNEMTGDENLWFFGKIQNLSGRILQQRVDWALEFVQLQDRRKDRVATYSGGMKRRLNLAVALVHDPPLLLLDEPTVGVDPQSRNAIFDHIFELRRRGKTILYTTHYMEEAQRLCDRVAIMDHGRLLALGTVAELISRYGGRDVVVVETAQGEKSIATDDPVAELEALRAQGDLLRFRVERSNLERVFLNLTGRQLRDE
jgi:ABC-2 type transport system ATP-binding protein